MEDNSGSQPLLDDQDTDRVNILPGPNWSPRNTSDDDSNPQAAVKLYPRRWYILAIFASLCALQGGIWNTWGPISSSSEKVFGWSDADIALLSNWGPIAYIVSAAPFAWLMDVKGLRWAALVTASLVAAGTGLRCITSQNPAATWLIHTGQLLNGLGGPVAMGAAPLLSAVWFPAHQRTRATAFVAVLNGLGVSVSFIIGPLLVPDRSNGSLPHNASGIFTTLSPAEDYLELTKMDIMKLMYIEFGLSAGVFLVMLIYFPSGPPKPPSITASIDRTDFLAGLKGVFRHKVFWLLAAPYAISGGVYNCWASVLEMNLKERNFSQDTSGWVGFYSSVAGCIAGLVVAGFADIFKKRMKLYMLTLFSGATATFTCFSIAYMGVIPLTKGLLYSLLILGAIFLSSVSPLFFELCCESTYPVAEGLTNSVLTWLNNLLGLIFLLVLMIPQIGKEWMNWCLAGSAAICIPILCLVKERYTRLDIDTQSDSGPINSETSRDPL